MLIITEMKPQQTLSAHSCLHCRWTSKIIFSFLLTIGGKSLVKKAHIFHFNYFEWSDEDQVEQQ